MGLFNFVKDAGEKLWDAVTGQHDKDDQAKKVQEHLSKTGIPDADKVNIQIADGKATVTGDGLSQEAKEKILVAVGNISGIASVDDQVKTATPATASQFYTVKSGDTIIHDKNFTDFRLLYGLSSRFAIGPAIYFNKKQANRPLISSYKTRRLGVLGKFNLSPNTTPRSYAVAEAGAMKRSLSYLRSLEDSSTSPYLMFGLGTEVDIYSGFFLGLEGQVSYCFKDNLGNFFQINSPWEASFTLRTGFHF